MAAEWRLEVASLESPLPLTDADASIKKTNEVSRDPVHNRQTETRWPLNACSDISPRHFEQTAPLRSPPAIGLQLHSPNETPLVQRSPTGTRQAPT